MVLVLEILVLIIYSFGTSTDVIDFVVNYDHPAREIIVNPHRLVMNAAARRVNKAMPCI